MAVIVTDAGFAPDDWTAGFTPLADLGPGAIALDLPNTADPALLAGRLGGLRLIRIAFPAFNDGRGLTLGRRLRMAGYAGRLRAAGHVIADQYAMVRRTGFDEVEIDDDLAARQPWPQWQARGGWRRPHYQSRLRA
jgi:uncharacterized protein (DUF934 family)